MKKNVKRIILAVVIVFVVLAGIAAYNFYPMLVMEPAETGYISDTNIYSAKIGMNSVYFVDTGGGYIMIDAGSDQKALEAAIKDAGIGAGDVKWVLLTHSDYDHVAALPLFPDAVIHISENEIPLINGAVKRSGGSYNSLPDEVGTDYLVPLRDGAELSFAGASVKCFDAPGHTPGSMMYLIDNRYLFTGDAFMIQEKGLGVHPFTMDEEAAKNTIERLKDTINGSEAVITAHYGYFLNQKIEVASTGNPTPEEVLAGNPDADFFVWDGVVCINASDVEWVQKLDLLGGVSLGEIERSGIKEGFKDLDATVLEAGTEIFELPNSGGVMIARNDGESTAYLKLLEG